jgi:hypothetical protein
MDRNLVCAMSRPQARKNLADFLDFGARSMDDFLTEVRRGGIDARYDTASLPAVLIWTLQRMETTPKLPDMSLPEWIRNTESYRNGLLDFTSASETRLLKAAYYKGECFKRTHRSLSWSTGDQRSYEANMPVVAGFRNRLELPPITVVRNIFMRIIADGAGHEDAAEAVEVWEGYVRR